MSNENWIKFEDEMPKLNQDIEIKYKSGKIFKSRFVIGTSSSITGIFLLACEDYYADIEKLEGWRPLKIENDKADDWILFTDALPLVDKKIEVKFENGSICETKLESVFFTNFHLSEDYEYLPGAEKAIKWRYKKEKRPDFSKLKEKDMLRLTLRWGKEEEIFIGFLVCMDEDILTMSPIFTAPYPHNSFTYHKSTVKSIIKINPETKEFEEI